MRNFLIIGLAILLICGSGCESKIDPQAEAEAVASAEAWLALMDAGKYAQGWREAAQFLQDSVSEEQWVQAMTADRKPIGLPLSRKVKSTEYRTMRPGALKGRYVIIAFETSFAKKPVAVESITQMMEKDGTWRVGGYHLE